MAIYEMNKINECMSETSSRMDHYYFFLSSIKSKQKERETISIIIRLI